MANLDFLRNLKAEIDTDPLGRGYSGMTDAQVATDINTAYRSVAGDVVTAVRLMVISNKKRANSGTDLTAYSILGRTRMMARASDGDNVFGNGPPTNNASYISIGAANSLLELLSWPDGSISFLTDATSAPWFDEILQSLVDSDVMGGPDKMAIQAATDNKQSRASELGFIKVTEARVTDARAL